MRASISSSRWRSGCLSLYWILTGLIALGPGWSEGLALLSTPSLPPFVTKLVIVLGALLDIALGAMLLVRPLTRAVLITMLVVCVPYLLAATFIDPCAVARSARAPDEDVAGDARDPVHPRGARRAMTNLVLALKLVHVLGAAVLFGTGLGIAFFMWMAHRTRDPATIAGTARIVVIADAVFTASAVIVQPVSGVALAWAIGYSLTEPWILVAIALYVLVGLCWLPVVWIQLRLRDIAAYAARTGRNCRRVISRSTGSGSRLGWPAFLGVIAIFAVMIWKPQLW